jgi:hypothetical protein
MKLRRYIDFLLDDPLYGGLVLAYVWLFSGFGNVGDARAGQTKGATPTR